MFNMPDENIIKNIDSDLPADSTGPARLILIMGRALLTLGSPSHRLEAALSKVAERLNLQAQFFCTPSALFAAIGNAEKQRTYLIRETPAGTDLSRLSDILDVVENVGIGASKPALAAEKIDHILQRAPLYPQWLAFFSYIILGVPVSFLLGGGWNEALLAGIASAVVGLLSVLFKPHDNLKLLLVPLAATIVSFLTMSWCAWQQNTELMPALMAGLIALLPGFDLTVATRELSTGNVVSGSARLATVFLVFTTLIFGLALGSTLAQHLFGVVTEMDAHSLGVWVNATAAFFASIGFLLLFNAYTRDWVWIFLGVLVAWFAGTFGTHYMGQILGAFIGGLSVGLAGNLYAKYSGRPGSIVLIPGLLLLVPGAVGFRGLSDLLNTNVISGIQTSFLALLTAVALTTGMIVSNAIIKPNNEL